MATNANKSPDPASPRFDPDANKQPRPTLASSTQERLQCIEALGQRINGYIQYICAAGALSGSSTEAKERAIAAFYERMVVLERHLSRIQEELKCG